MATATAMYYQEAFQMGYNLAVILLMANKINIRHQTFRESYPSFEEIFHNLMNCNPTLFKDDLKFYVDITYCLS